MLTGLVDVVQLAAAAVAAVKPLFLHFSSGFMLGSTCYAAAAAAADAVSYS